MHSPPLSLALNPAANISINSHEEPPTFLIEAPIRGVSYSSVEVDAENLPSAHAFLYATLIDGSKVAQIDEQAATELCQIGLFAAANAVPQFHSIGLRIRDRYDPAPRSRRLAVRVRFLGDLAYRPNGLNKRSAS